MQFPESWLREFCDPPIDSATLARTLTMAGLEVEAMRTAAPPFHGVVVGHVLAVVNHPNADRLRVCKVDVGAPELLDIVCGAPNVRAGIKVPCALVGAELPPADAAAGSAAPAPMSIRLGQIRGVESRGMLCSARELKLSEDHGGLLVLADGAVVGRDIRTQLDLDDTLFTLKLTPNLGHCLSVYGVARELAAITGAPLRPLPAGAPGAPIVEADVRRVLVEAPDLCGRFSGRVIRHIDASATTPSWMVDRLARCGQRSISPLVDISNYVMFESGQPTHVFDLEKIHGDLTVRWGRAAESLVLLNGSSVDLDNAVGVIADEGSVESLAGIMGGAATAVSDSTRHVYVEAAFWWPQAVAGRARRYHFTTDAGHRFERGVDPQATVARLERVSQLIVEICGNADTRCGPLDDQVVSLPSQTPIRLRVDRASKVIGMPVTQTQCEAVMSRLGFAFTSAPGVLDVVPPSWRFDLTIEEDLIEEIIRLIGYDELPAGAPKASLVARVTSESKRDAWTLRRSLAALGYQETIGFSFVDESLERELSLMVDPIHVLNPIAANLSVMRTTLLGSLLLALKVNVARKATRFQAFEIGKVYLRDAATGDGPTSVAGVRQPLRVAGLAYGPADPLQWSSRDRAMDFYDAKGDVEALLAPARATFVAAAHPAFHPGRSAAVEVDGIPVGFVGELHPRWRQSHELPGSVMAFELDADVLLSRTLPAFVALPRQQPVWRDIAVVVGPAVTHDELIAAVMAEPSGLVRSARLFDVYKPEASVADMADDERSLALRLELRDDDASLTDERIDAVIAGVLAAIAARIRARLRR